MKDFVLDSMRRQGRLLALDLQSRAGGMTGTELYAESEYIPKFQAVRTAKNMLNREIGFVCKSSAGRVVRLLQPYDSDIYTVEPEELSAQWGFVWSDDPTKALPFIALATSPFMTGNCCTENGKTYRSKVDNNVHAPSAYTDGWEEVE